MDKYNVKTYNSISHLGLEKIKHLGLSINSDKTANAILLRSHKLSSDEIKESVLFEKKIFNRSKGLLKLLDVGELKSSINIEVSYASKNAIAKVEKNGGKVNLIKI